MTEMFGEAWSPMSVPDLAPDDDDDDSCPVGKIIKFSINKTYNRKTWRVLSNQQGKNHTKVEYRESSNFVFLFPQLCKNRHSLFLPLGASIGATSCQSNQ